MVGPGAAQLSLYFPDIEGTSLATKEKVHTTDLFENKISLVVFSSFRSSEVSVHALSLSPALLPFLGMKKLTDPGLSLQEHINSFVRPTLADLDGDSRFQYVYVSLFARR